MNLFLHPVRRRGGEQGVSVGATPAQFLGKIEELALPQIAQEKEIQGLRAEVATLRMRQP